MKKYSIHLVQYNIPSSPQYASISTPSNQPLFSKLRSRIDISNTHKVLIYHDDAITRHDKNCKILVIDNLKILLLSWPKQIISKKSNTNQHSESSKTTHHNIKHIDSKHNTNTMEIHSIIYIYTTKQNSINYGDSYSSVSKVTDSFRRYSPKY